MQMQLQHINPHPLLKGYIEKMWVFESSRRVPNDDMKLVVPNGLIKLVVPFRNGLSGKMEDGWFHLSKEHSITLIGIADIPAKVESEKDCRAGTIGVEFSPQGAYRFFNLRQSEIKNKIHPLTDILGNIAKQLEEEIANTESVKSKVFLLQQFLIKLFSQNEADNIFDYCVQKINLTKGKITVNELEKETGYSSRWLHMKFIDKVGISPKNLSSIIRFQQYYHALARNSEMMFMEKEFYNYYYDQSHFIKEFKRFTGLSPVRFENANNDFGKIFYRD
jgi:AraC-like DNA-binding protein